MAISNYRTPGVFVERARNAGDVALLTGARIPVIIGRGQRTYEPGAVFVPASSHNKDGVDQFLSSDPSVAGATEIISVGDYPDQSKYVQGVDFLFSGSISSPSKQIDWSPATANQPKTAAEGGQGYYVRYKARVPSSQYDYHLYTDENEIIATYGPESQENLATVGAIVALRNGAPAVGIVQLDLDGGGGTSYPAADPDNPTEAELRSAFIEALDRLENLNPEDCRILVPMTTDDQVFTEYLDHVGTMSLASQRRWRTLIRGVAQSASSKNSTARDLILTTVQSYQSSDYARRITVVGPGEVSRIIRDASNNFVPSRVYFDGSVLAAAAAGKICSYSNPATTLTRKQISGLSLERQFSKADIRLMGAEGATVFYTTGAQVVCSHWLTPDLRDAATQEASVTEIEDAIKWQLDVVLDAAYVGELITPGILTSIKGTVETSLDEFIRLGTIVDYSNVAVSFSSTDPRNVEIAFEVLPAYPVNWIDITFIFQTGVEGTAAV